MRRLLFLVFAVQTLTTSMAAAQSLGDVARQEEARRKAVPPSGKVYTNDGLRPEPATASPAPAASTPPPAGNTTPAAPKTDPAQDRKKDEASWRQRMTAARDALKRSEIFAEALQSRINALSADFSARDDPFQRNQIGLDRQKALAELDRVKKDVVDQTKAIGDIQEEARKAGVPAGWVR